MDSSIEGYLDGIKSDSLSLIRGELSGFIDGLKARSDDFSKAQHAKLEKYLLQLAAQQLNKQQFADAIADMVIAADAEATLEKVETKAAAQRVSDGLTKLVINGLIKAIPG